MLGSAAGSCRQPNRPGKSPCVKRLPTTASATAPAGSAPKCRPRAMRWAAGASAACSKRTACGPSSRARSCRARPIRTPLYRLRPIVYSASRPPPPPPGVGGRHHVLAPAGRRLAVPGRLARPLLAQDCGPGRARHDARRLGQRGPAPGPSRAPARGWSHCALRLGQPIHGHPLQSPGRKTRRAAKYEPARQLLRQRPRRIVLEPL